MKNSTMIKALCITVLILIATNSSVMAQVYCDPTGRVSIGMTDPNFNLDVSGDINFTGNLYRNGNIFAPGNWTESGGNICRDTGVVGIGDIFSGYKLSITEGIEQTKGIYVQSDHPSQTDYVYPYNLLYLKDIDLTDYEKESKFSIKGRDGVTYLISETNWTGALAFVTRRSWNYYERMRILSTGEVGIGTKTPNYKLEVNGTAGKPEGGTWADSSDSRLKKNIKPLSGALDKLTKLRGVTFEWINPEEHMNQDSELEKDTNQSVIQKKNKKKEVIRKGLIAQEVEKVFPEWVLEIKPKGKDKTLVAKGEKIKALFFPHDFNAYVIEAIKELNALIDGLKTETNQLRAENAGLKKEISVLKEVVRQ